MAVIYLMMQEIVKIDVKLSVIPNVLEKYIAFKINKIFVFIDSMQFMNSSLYALVKICQIVILSIYYKDVQVNN